MMTSGVAGERDKEAAQEAAKTEHTPALPLPHHKYTGRRLLAQTLTQRIAQQLKAIDR